MIGRESVESASDARPGCSERNAQISNDLEVFGELELEILLQRAEDETSSPTLALAVGDRSTSSALRREEEQVDVRVDL